MKKLALKLINFYQRVTHNLPHVCKYTPSCSNYAKQCYENYNIITASFLTLWRLLRCNPFSRGGYDPIPKIKKTLTKEEIDGYYDIDFDEDNEKEESYSDSSSFK